MNNVYVRSKNSIFNISKYRILSLIPLILFGLYQNGYKFYKIDHELMTLFKPLMYILAGLIIGILVNLILTKKEKKMSLNDILFSSFHLEYGIILGCLMSNSVNIIVYSICLLVLFIITKFIDIKINVLALAFIIIYAITSYTGGFTYNEVLGKTNELKDYFIGFIPGGMCATSFILLLVSYLILKVSSSSKTDITLYAFITYGVLSLVYAFISKIPFIELLTMNSYFFTFVYVATESLSSCYTLNGTKLFGLLLGLMTFIISFINPILASYISILVLSLLHILIDKIGNKIKTIN